MFLQSLNVENERVCGEPADGDSRYRPAHPKELPSFMHAKTQKTNLSSDSRLSM
jgi:hypothetical protein